MSDDELTLDDVTEDIPPQIDDEEVEEVEEDSTDEPESRNPAWDELLDVLPKSLHGMVKPVLDKWQSGIDSEFEKIAPYRKFADADVNPQIIEASMDLARQVQSNPKAVYDELAQRYGWSAAQQMVEEASDNLEEAEEMDLFSDSESTSELKALKSELDALKSAITSQQEASEQEALSNQIEQSLQSLGKEAGDFDQEAVVRRAMLLADDYPDADIAQLIQAGYEQYSGEVEKMRSAIKKAPRVAGGSANKSPAAPVKTLNTREDRINAIEEIVKRTLNI